MSEKKFTAAERAENCVLDLEAAVYQAAMKPRGTLGSICEKFGLTYNTTVLQVNPNRTCHTLPPMLIEQVLSATKSPQIMDAICVAHGNSGWFLVPDADDQSDEMVDIALLAQKFADLNFAALDAYANHIVSHDELAHILKDGQALIRHVQTMMESAKRNNAKHYGDK